MFKSISQYHKIIKELPHVARKWVNKNQDLTKLPQRVRKAKNAKRINSTKSKES